MASVSGDFENKVAIVSGASAGLGRAVAILFAQKGCAVTLCGRNQEKLASSLDACVKASGGHAAKFISIAGDITVSGHRAEIVEKTIAAFGRLDVLVANAAVGIPGGNIIEATEDIFDKMFNTNVKASFFLIQTALPHLEKTQGNIVAVSSVLSTMANGGGSVLYPMTKAATDHMVRCLALDLAPKGIRVNAVNPSYFPSDLIRRFGNLEEITKTLMASESKNQPLRGECISAQDVANLIAFLASDAARTITGQCHVIDGGRTFMQQTMKTTPPTEKASN